MEEQIIPIIIKRKIKDQFLLKGCFRFKGLQCVFVFNLGMQLICEPDTESQMKAAAFKAAEGTALCPHSASLKTRRTLYTLRTTSALWAVRDPSRQAADPHPSTLRWHVESRRTPVAAHLRQGTWAITGRVCVCVTVRPCVCRCLNEAMFKTEAQRERGVK